MHYTYTDPDGKEYADIPVIWRVGGKNIALAGDWTRAERHGWSRRSVTAVKHWSKYAILSALAANGLAESFLAILQADPLLYNLWLAAGDIADDDPAFQRALPAVLAALGLTEEQARAMLEGCEIQP